MFLCLDNCGCNYLLSQQPESFCEHVLVGGSAQMLSDIGKELSTLAFLHLCCYVNQ